MYSYKKDKKWWKFWSKSKYVVMNFDYGGSLCECDVYSSLDEVKEMM